MTCVSVVDDMRGAQIDGGQGMGEKAETLIARAQTLMTSRQFADAAFTWG